jgi:SAM-dependent methyltransferase
MTQDFGAQEISFGADVVNDTDLRVCGDLRGKRMLELGLHGAVPNCIVAAQKGARAIAVDPSDTLIAQARAAASRADVAVEFHHNDIADLGLMRSASLDLVLCVHQITIDTDEARLFRQVHRVLKPEAGFVFVIGHPAAAIFDGDGAGNNVTIQRQYGSTTPTIGQLAMSLQRANFSIDIMHELTSLRQPRAVVPSTLVVRARKLGS